MSKFPQPITLPEEIPQAREQRWKQIRFSSLTGIAIRSSIILLELGGVYFSGSAALLVDAISSIIDVFTSLILLFCIQLASKPPDTNHPFGHGRFEPIAGLQMGLMFGVVGACMFFYQLFQVATIPREEVMNPYVWIIALIATILMELCYRILMKSAQKNHSPALAADAAHYRIDSLTSLIATIALLVAAVFPAWGLFFDHVGALAIAVFMIVIGFFASRDNLHQLSDRIPPKEFFERVRYAAEKVEGVKGTEKIRIQQYGPDAHVDIDIEVDPNLSVEIAHEISQRARIAIQKEWPDVRDVTVHIEPFYANDH